MTTIVERGAEPYIDISGGKGRALFSLTQAWAWMKRRRQIAVDRRHLQEMPDELLRDIGVGRSEIASVTEFGRAILPRH